MSSLRVGLVAEGPTDGIVIEAALRSILGPDRPFVLNLIQPEGSVAFGALGTGWVGVYRWCKQAAQNGRGRLGGFELLFTTHDLVLLHLDADVAAMKYEDGSLVPEAGDGALPCEKECPPAEATTEALREVLLSWVNENTEPPKVALCLPSKSTEAWVVLAVLPDDPAAGPGIECFPQPVNRLSQQKKAVRFTKSRRDYLDRQDQLRERWPVVASTLTSAARFQAEVLRIRGPEPRVYPA